MSAKSTIEWTDSTWTPIRARVREDAAAIAQSKGYTSLVQIAEKMAGRVGVHCEKVSPACNNCYAETQNGRCLPAHGTGLPYDRRSRDLVEVFVDEKILLQPLQWRKPRRIFVCSQTDLFAEFVTDEMIDRVFAAMALCPEHTFQLLTKRPERTHQWHAKPSGFGFTWRQGYIQNAAYAIKPEAHFALTQWPLSNVWLGVTAENQEQADARIPLLLQTPAAVRFVSVEPMLGPVDLENLPSVSGIGRYLDALQNHRDASGVGSLDWVIAGGESGRGARPAHPDWLRSVRDQCQQAGVPFFFKQWGEFLPYEERESDGCFVPSSEPDLYSGRSVVEGADIGTGWYWPQGQDIAFRRVGKTAAGRLLDGVEWSQVPGGAA